MILRIGMNNMRTKKNTLLIKKTASIILILLVAFVLIWAVNPAITELHKIYTLQYINGLFISIVIAFFLIWLIWSICIRIILEDLIELLTKRTFVGAIIAISTLCVTSIWIYYVSDQKKSLLENFYFGCISSLVTALAIWLLGGKTLWENIIKLFMEQTQKLHTEFLPQREYQPETKLGSDYSRDLDDAITNGSTFTAVGGPAIHTSARLKSLEDCNNKNISICIPIYSPNHLEEEYRLEALKDSQIEITPSGESIRCINRKELVILSLYCLLKTAHSKDIAINIYLYPSVYGGFRFEMTNEKMFFVPQNKSGGKYPKSYCFSKDAAIAKAMINMVSSITNSAISMGSETLKGVSIEHNVITFTFNQGFNEDQLKKYLITLKLCNDDYEWKSVVNDNNIEKVFSLHAK
jgi:hypothetical protein